MTRLTHPPTAAGRMRLTLHATRRTPHGASRLVQAMPAWSVKTRHAPSRHCRDARDYGVKTTTTHEMCALPYAMSAWSVKTRHDPSRHCRDARDHGVNTTATHEIPPPLRDACLVGENLACSTPALQGCEGLRC